MFLLINVQNDFHLFQPKRHLKKLSCWYKKSHPLLVLSPAKIEQVYVYPEMYLYRNVLSDKELQRIKDLALPMVRFNNCYLTLCFHCTSTVLIRYKVFPVQEHLKCSLTIFFHIRRMNESVTDLQEQWEDDPIHLATDENFYHYSVNGVFVTVGYSLLSPVTKKWEAFSRSTKI